MEGYFIKDGQSDTMCTVHDGHNKTTQTFKYHQPFGDFYIYCHVVDDNNKYCHNTDTKCGLSLETTWVTHMWANRAFAFIIRICKVNAYLAANDHWDKSFLSFRSLPSPSSTTLTMCTSWEKWGGQGVKQMKFQVTNTAVHWLVFTQHWTGKLWDTSSKTKYPQYHCKTPGCRNRVCTFCSCDRASWMCRTCCCIRHVQEVTRSTWSRHLIQNFRI